MLEVMTSTIFNLTNPIFIFYEDSYILIDNAFTTIGKVCLSSLKTVIS